MSVLGSDPDAYTALQVQSSALQAQAGSVDVNMISNTLTTAVPNLAGDLAVAILSLNAAFVQYRRSTTGPFAM